MGAGENKTLIASCVGCGKDYPTQRHPNVPQITGFPVQVGGVVQSVPLCRECIEKGITAEEAVGRPAKTTQ